MPQCNVCMESIDEKGETHIRVVKPVEYKGSTEEIRHYYCQLS